MADPVNIGTVAFTELEAHDRWTIVQGWVKVRTWTGMITLLDSFLNSQLPAGYTSLDIERAYPAAKVTAEYPSTGEPGDTPHYQPDPITRSWQLIPAREETSIWNLPKVVAEWQKVPVAQRGPLVRWINDNIDFGASEDAAFPVNGMVLQSSSNEDEPVASVAPFTSITPTWFSNRVLADLYKRLLLNQDTVPILKYVLRKVDTIGSYSALRASHADEMRMWTLAQIKAAEPSITADVQLEIEAAKLTKFWWYKNPTTSEPVQNGLKQITSEWEAYAYFDNFVHKKKGEADDKLIDMIPRK